MAIIRPSQLPPGASANPSGAIPIDQGTNVEKVTPKQVVDAGVPLASQVDAEAGNSNDDRMSSLRVKQAIDAQAISSARLSSTAPGDGVDMISYLQDGTGAVPLPLSNRSKQIVYSSEFRKSAVDGLTDNSSDLQEAINASVNKVLFIEPGEYRMDNASLDIPDNSEIWFMAGASIKLMPVSPTTPSTIRISHGKNVVIWNPVLDGNQSSRTVGGYGASHGIHIRGNGENIRIYNAVTNNYFADGINIGWYQFPASHSKNVHIVNHRADRCRRQGLSLTSGDGIFIEKALWTNIGIAEIDGVIPGAGIDIEPASPRDSMKNIRVTDCETRGCERGFVVNLDLLLEDDSTGVADVSIIRPIDRGSRLPYSAVACQDGQTYNNGLERALILLDNPMSFDAQNIPFVLNGIPDVCEVRVIRPYISEPNTANLIGYSSVVFRVSAATRTGTGFLVTGNVHIIEPSVYSKNTNVARLWHPGVGDGSYTDLSLIDPLYIEPRLVTAVFGTVPDIDPSEPSLFRMSDVRRTCVRKQSGVEDMDIYPPPHNEQTTIISITKTLPYATGSYLHPIEFRWMPGSVGATQTFQPKPGDTIVGLGAGMTKIRATAHGSTITFEQLSPGHWAIANKSGQWEEIA